MSGAAAGAVVNNGGSNSSRFTLFKSRFSKFKVSPSCENFTVLKTGAQVLKGQCEIFPLLYGHTYFQGVSWVNRAL